MIIEDWSVFTGLCVHGLDASADIRLEVSDDFTKILGWKIVSVTICHPCGKFRTYKDMSLDGSVDPMILSDQIQAHIQHTTESILFIIKDHHGYVRRDLLSLFTPN